MKPFEKKEEEQIKGPYVTEHQCNENCKTRSSGLRFDYEGISVIHNTTAVVGRLKVLRP